MWRSAALLFVAFTLLAAQTQTGAISGVVRDADTGAPLADVSVSIAGGQTKTDSQGRFRLAGVEAGLQRVWASDPPRAAAGGTSITVKAGEEATADIALKIGGSIAGRVVDSDGRAVAGAVVLLLYRSYNYGELVYAPLRTAATDRNGEYRMDGVPVQQGLFVLVKERLSVTVADAVPPYDGRERVLLPTFYGNASDIAAAQRITLTSGEHREHVDVRIAHVPAYCVEGTVEGAGAKEAFVNFAETLGFDSAWALTPATVRASANGKFQVCGLHAGEYRVVAGSALPANGLSDRISGRAENAFARCNIAITDRDLRDIKPLPDEAVRIVGDASFDPAPAERQAKVAISLMRMVSDEDYADAVQSPPATSVRMGALSMGGASVVPGPLDLGRWRPGELYLRVSRLPAGCYIKEATYSRQDLLRGLLRLSEAAGDQQVRLVIGCDGATVTARVTDPDGKPVEHTNLYLFDADAGGPGALAASLRRAEVAVGWSTPLTAVRPGKYLALVSDELSVTPPFCPADAIEALWNAKSEAKPVEAGPSAIVQVTISNAQ